MVGPKYVHIVQRAVLTELGRHELPRSLHPHVQVTVVRYKNALSCRANLSPEMLRAGRATVNAQVEQEAQSVESLRTDVYNFGNVALKGTAGHTHSDTIPARA